jgi:hypothetical protein
MAIFAGKCPSCDTKNVKVKYRAMAVREHFGTGQLNCVVYTCSSCEAILGVQADPIAIMADQTERIAKRLGAPTRR